MEEKKELSPMTMEDEENPELDAGEKPVSPQSSAFEEDEDGGEPEEEKKRRISPKAKKRLIIFLIIAAVIAGVVAGVVAVSRFMIKRKTEALQAEPITVQKRDIVKSISGKSVIEPNDSYAVNTIITGEIVSDTFEEGDYVNKDDVLYVFDTDTAENNVKSAENTLKKAQETYDSAVKANSLSNQTDNKTIESAKLAVTKAQQTYDDAQKAKNDLSITSQVSGKVKTVYVNEGDMITQNGKIADVYDDTYMKIKIPFNSPDADKLYIGEWGLLTISGTGNEVYGSITDIDSYETMNSAHMQLKYVTFELENPGALTPEDKAAAVVDGIACNDAGSFEYIEENTIYSKTAGTVEALNIYEGKNISYGQTVARLSSDSVESQLKNAQTALREANTSLEKAMLQSNDYTKTSNVETAKIALDDAKLKLEDAKKGLDDYTIKAPISGKVVTKNIKKGDKVDTKTATTAMAEIYDLSSLKFQLDVDEMEVKEIKAGQTVKIKADAVENEEFTGIVDTIGINGKSENGVTTYPVTVSIKDYGSLMPGMNIDAEIEVSKASGVLSVPVSSIKRGNIVYVKGEKDNENDKAPEGYKSATVVTGINDEDYIEIKSGLKEGDIIKSEEAPQSNMNGFPMGGGMPGGGMGRSGGAPGAMGGR